MYTLGEFNQHIVNNDFQRSNMFSVVFATKPHSKTQALLDRYGSALYNNIPLGLDFLGIKQGDVQQAITSIITMGTQTVVRKSGISKYLIGAMTNRVVQSLLGEFEVGTYLLDFFDMSFPQSGLMVHAVKVPENRLQYDMDKMHNSPNIKIMGREFDPLVITFRMDPAASNYRAMNDWVNAVEDPVTGLRALPEDVEADIQVALHNRKGLPHTAIMLTGCIPVGVSSPELTYDGDSQITIFDVTFAYRVVQTGAVSEQAALEWVEGKTINQIEDINPNMSRSDQTRRYESRLG